LDSPLPANLQKSLTATPPVLTPSTTDEAVETGPSFDIFPEGGNQLELVVDTKSINHMPLRVSPSCSMLIVDATPNSTELEDMMLEIDDLVIEFEKLDETETETPMQTLQMTTLSSQPSLSSLHSCSTKEHSDAEDEFKDSNEVEFKDSDCKESACEDYKNHEWPVPPPGIRPLRALSSPAQFHPSTLRYRANTFTMRKERSQPFNKGPDPVCQLLELMTDRDDEERGTLELDDFVDALNEADHDVDDNDVEHIFKLFSDEQDRVDIVEFIQHVRSKYNEHMHKAVFDRNAKVPSSTRAVFRSAFPDVFGEFHSLENREVWGDAQVRCMLTLRDHFEAEAESADLLDYPEFASALNNMSITRGKSPSSKQLFERLLQAQECDEEEGELSLKFLMATLDKETRSRKYNDLKPKEMTKLMFADLLSGKGSF